MIRLFFGNPVRFFEIIAILLLLLLVVIQVVIPLLKSEPIFPFYRRRSKLQHELDDAEERVREEKLRDQIEATRKAAEQIRLAREAKPEKPEPPKT